MTFYEILQIILRVKRLGTADCLLAVPAKESPISVG